MQHCLVAAESPCENLPPSEKEKMTRTSRGMGGGAGRRVPLISTLPCSPWRLWTLYVTGTPELATHAEKEKKKLSHFPEE